MAPRHKRFCSCDGEVEGGDGRVACTVGGYEDGKFLLGFVEFVGGLRKLDTF